MRSLTEINCSLRPDRDYGMGIFGIADANQADTRLFTRLMKEECWKRVSISMSPSHFHQSESHRSWSRAGTLAS